MTVQPRSLYSDNKKLTTINFFGGPGCGKSTTAAELFAAMKKQHLKVELVHEAAQDFVWEDWNHIFGEQDWIFAHQHRLIRRLVRHDIDYAVIDSSILLSLFYMPDDFPQSFRPFVQDVFDSYDNINIMLVRNPDIVYDTTGRNESEQQARDIDASIQDYFVTNNRPVHYVRAGDGAAADCLSIINQR
jgi:adenylate kinase family enzyme